MKDKVSAYCEELPDYSNALLIYTIVMLPWLKGHHKFLLWYAQLPHYLHFAMHSAKNNQKLQGYQALLLIV